MVVERELIKPKFLFMRNEDAEQILIDQFYTLLQAEYQRVQNDDYPEHPDHHLHEVIQNLFNQDKTWENAYHIEQLLVYLLREEDLDAKISRSLLDIQEILEHRYAYYHDELTDADMSHMELRSFESLYRDGSGCALLLLHTNRSDPR